MKLINVEVLPNDVEDYNDFIVRLQEKINSSLLVSQYFEPRSILPRKARIGQVMYFSKEILPEITGEGLWVYKSTGWTLIA
jgi:hypothetical protein